MKRVTYLGLIWSVWAAFTSGASLAAEPRFFELTWSGPYLESLNPPYATPEGVKQQTVAEALTEKLSWGLTDLRFVRQMDGAGEKTFLFQHSRYDYAIRRLTVSTWCRAISNCPIVEPIRSQLHLRSARVKFELEANGGAVIRGESDHLYFYDFLADVQQGIAIAQKYPGFLAHPDAVYEAAEQLEAELRAAGSAFLNSFHPPIADRWRMERWIASEIRHLVDDSLTRRGATHLEALARMDKFLKVFEASSQNYHIIGYLTRSEESARALVRKVTQRLREAPLTAGEGSCAQELATRNPA